MGCGHCGGWLKISSSKIEELAVWTVQSYVRSSQLCFGNFRAFGIFWLLNCLQPLAFGSSVLRGFVELIWRCNAAFSFDRYISSLLEASVTERHSRCPSCAFLWSSLIVSWTSEFVFSFEAKGSLQFHGRLGRNMFRGSAGLDSLDAMNFCQLFGRAPELSFESLIFLLKVKDTGLDHGVRSLHLLWAEGSLGIPGISWHIWLDGSDFWIEVASGRFTLGTMWPKVTTGSTYLNLMSLFRELYSETRTSKPVTSGKLDIQRSCSNVSVGGFCRGSLERAEKAQHVTSLTSLCGFLLLFVSFSLFLSLLYLVPACSCFMSISFFSYSDGKHEKNK